MELSAHDQSAGSQPHHRSANLVSARFDTACGEDEGGQPTTDVSGARDSSRVSAPMAAPRARSGERTGRLIRIAVLAAVVLVTISGSGRPQVTVRPPRLIEALTLDTVFNWGNAYQPNPLQWVRSSAPAVASWLQRENLPSQFGVPFDGDGYVVEIAGHFQGDGRRGGALVLLMPVTFPAPPGRFAYVSFVWRTPMDLASLGSVHQAQFQPLVRFSKGRIPDMLGLTSRQAASVAKHSHISIKTRGAPIPGLPVGTVVAQSPPPGTRSHLGRVELTVSFPAPG